MITHLLKNVEFTREAIENDEQAFHTAVIDAVKESAPTDGREWDALEISIRYSVMPTAAEKRVRALAVEMADKDIGEYPATEAERKRTVDHYEKKILSLLNSCGVDPHKLVGSTLEIQKGTNREGDKDDERDVP